MERLLIGRDVAWPWPTTTARSTTTTQRAQEPKHHRTQAALRFPRRDLEKLKTGSPPGETIGLPKSIEWLRKTHRGTGREQRDAPYRPCRLHHERRAQVPVEHFRLELSKPRHSSHQGNTTNPLYFFINHFIHPYVHSFYTPMPPK